MHDANDTHQAVILDHSSRPRNFLVLADASHIGHAANPACGDAVTVYLTLDAGRIAAITFQGKGCAISQASASLMTLLLQDQPLDRFGLLWARFRHLVTTGETDEIPDETAALAGVHRFPARIKCALLGWQAVLDAVKSQPS
ncbi:MAG: SUF system NifU family Fe-S cluster assembly protein [Verrucomicrobiota bacterium]